MPIVDELCRQCGTELRFGAQSSSRFCSTRCRVAAHRRRMRDTWGIDRRPPTPRAQHVDHRPEPAPRVDHQAMPASTPELEPLDDIDAWIRAPIQLDGHD